MKKLLLIDPGEVSVLIGPNGSGKSRLMRKLCINYLDGGYKVIAIAPTIYDRFKTIRRKNFRFFGARQGSSAAIDAIRSALEQALSKDPLILKNLTRALEYTNFDPVIGIGLSNLNFDGFPVMTERLSKIEQEELHSALLKWQSQVGRDGVVRLKMESFSLGELDSLTFAVLARHDELLYRTKTTSRIEYFLYRNGEKIRLMDACSGELNFITTVAFISTKIERNSVIAIDEPETSLHPAWQQSYVRTLLDLFHLYEPRILISTHSPIIISGAEIDSAALTVHEVKDGQIHLFDHAKLSLEEMYDRLFGLITPKNHYLSQLAVALLNALNAGEKSLNAVLRDFEVLRSKSYDQSQKDVITRFEEIARKLDIKRQDASI